jgi:Holliday junction resolvasome RuvABC endonuclease subunit
MNVLGVDPSLTSTGLCVKHPDSGITTCRIRPGKYLKGPSRLAYSRREIEQALHEEVELVCYEGYSMGSRNGRMFDIGELGGVLKTLFYERGLPTLIVPPSTLKLFVTGKGNAKKVDMVEAVMHNWGHQVKSDDEADAYALYRLGTEYLSSGPRRAAKAKKIFNACEYVSGGVLRTS